MEVFEDKEDCAVRDAAVQADLGQSSSAPHEDAHHATITVSNDCQTEAMACDTCVAIIQNNSLVKAGRISTELANILVVPPAPMKKASRKSGAKGGILLISEEELTRLRKDVEDRREKEEAKVRRIAEQQERHEKKKKQEATERRQEGPEGRGQKV